ncbi:U1 small nuclear ribonucleoprotein [Trypanosoma rangeli]|uniref:U1 small nuclear ribonucleoprotein n=1 Tax=Trypanosoma rangeli TaxID=5698 RepID=A0A422NE56_TRYRA|nr:U1 small nuclear ribonucleoprotein [Trypanosoma rangeli]RNF03780.1 U1 small nuclear ribonucleoprotein [Trypanosoma rangeli]|eukprot:RNF03780.1 U1 small nuclear ribonucleoprotein [Trypanosoma rangeli]
MQAPSDDDVARQEAFKRRVEAHAQWKRNFFQSRPPPLFIPKCRRRRRERIAGAPVHALYKRALQLVSAEAGRSSPALSPLRQSRRRWRSRRAKKRRGRRG